MAFTLSLGAHKEGNKLSYTWEGKYRSGKMTITKPTKAELDKALDELGVESFQVNVSAQSLETSGNTTADYPHIVGALGPSAAIMATMSSPWGRAEPRTEADIKQVLELNAIYFTQGSVSGTLTYLTQKGRLRRIPKGDKLAYIPTAEALIA
jgi:hypothetical protein